MAQQWTKHDNPSLGFVWTEEFTEVAVAAGVDKEVFTKLAEEFKKLPLTVHTTGNYLISGRWESQNEHTPLTSVQVERAIELLATEANWMKLKLWSGNSQCTIGAVARARMEAGIREDPYAFETELRQLMGLTLAVHTWNDDSSTTYDMVIDALTLAAKRLRELGR